MLKFPEPAATPEPGVVGLCVNLEIPMPESPLLESPWRKQLRQDEILMCSRHGLSGSSSSSKTKNKVYINILPNSSKNGSLLYMWRFVKACNYLPVLSKITFIRPQTSLKEGCFCFSSPCSGVKVLFRGCLRLHPNCWEAVMEISQISHMKFLRFHNFIEENNKTGFSHIKIRVTFN